MKWDKQVCPQCEKLVTTLYKKKREDIALCSKCYKKQVELSKGAK